MAKFDFGGVTQNVNSGIGQIGENHAVQHQGNDPPTVQSLFTEISKSLPPDTDEQTQLAHEALGNIELMANATPEVEAVIPEEKSSMMAMLKPYVDKLTPYAPLVTKAVLAFGDGYFSTLESKNAVVAGLVEMIKGMRS